MKYSILTSCVVAVWVANCGSPTIAENRFTTLDAVRRVVDAAGQVTDKNIERETGWTAIRAFTWSIELADPGKDCFTPVSADRAFKEGERFRLRTAVASTLYCYVLVHNADCTYEVLMPDKEVRVPKLEAGREQLLPETGAFKFTPPAGIEELWLVISSETLPFIAPQEIWNFTRKVQNGGALEPEEQAALANLKSVRAKSLDGAARTTQGLTVKKGLDAVIAEFRSGARARGAEVVATAPQQDVQLVVHGAPRFDPQAVIIEKIVLRHK